MLKIKVKANSITNLTDARYFAAREVTWTGFCLDPASEDYMAPQKVSAIAEWLDGVLLAGEFPLMDALEILETAEQLNLNAVQVHRFTTIEDLSELHRRVPVIQEVVMAPTEDLAALSTWMEARTDLTEAFLLDFTKNNMRWEDDPALQLWLKTICKNHLVILHLDFHAATLPEIITTLPLYGLAIKGGEEEKVGIKSFDELDALLELLESEEENALGHHHKL